MSARHRPRPAGRALDRRRRPERRRQDHVAEGAGAAAARARAQCGCSGATLAAWSARDRARQLAWLGQAEAGAEDLLRARRGHARAACRTRTGWVRASGDDHAAVQRGDAGEPRAGPGAAARWAASRAASASACCWRAPWPCRRAAAADGRAAVAPGPAAPGRLAGHRAAARRARRHGRERAARDRNGPAGRRPAVAVATAGWRTMGLAPTRPRIVRWKPCSTTACRSTPWPAGGSRCRARR